MTEFRIQLKQTQELNNFDKDSLIGLKQQYWNYDKPEQERWMHDNLMPDDYHVLIYFWGGALLAYLNAVNVEVTIDQFDHRMMGVGNVCVDHDHASMGLGSLLMSYINVFIRQSATCGILLCKDKLIPFYRSVNWKVLNPKIATISGKLYEHKTMLFDPHGIARLGEDPDLINLSRNF